MVSRFEDKAFFGWPPAPVRPTEADIASSYSSIPTPGLDMERLSTPASESDEEIESLGDVTYDTGEGSSSIEPQSTPALSVEVPPSRLGRSSAPEATFPHRYRSRGASDAEDLVARDLLNQDELDWRVWHEEELPIQFAKLRPSGVQTQVSFAYLGRCRAVETHKLTNIA